MVSHHAVITCGSKHSAPGAAAGPVRQQLPSRQTVLCPARIPNRVCLAQLQCFLYSKYNLFSMKFGKLIEKFQLFEIQMKMTKTSKNEGGVFETFWRAKRADKIVIPGFQEKTTAQGFIYITRRA